MLSTLVPALLALALISAGCSETTAGVGAVVLTEDEIQGSFEFEAPDPATHAFDVEIRMENGTELDVTFTTANGSTLYIFSGLGSDCEQADGRLTCLLPFPILEAQTAGTWTANAHRLSGPPGSVDISITWIPIDERP